MPNNLPTENILKCIQVASDYGRLGISTTATEELRRLVNSQFVPGEWVCDACGFVLHKSIINPTTGDVGANTDEVLESCPNDGIAMRRITLQEAYRQAIELFLNSQSRRCSAPESGGGR